LLECKVIPFAQTPDGILNQFRESFYDTQLFFDPFTGGKFAQYFFAAHDNAGAPQDADSAHRLVEEAQLFIEGCHSCYRRMCAQTVAA
jgi:hypothetical protein